MLYPPRLVYLKRFMQFSARLLPAPVIKYSPPQALNLLPGEMMG
jgi:hypothetical protein